MLIETKVKWYTFKALLALRNWEFEPVDKVIRRLIVGHLERTASDDPEQFDQKRVGAGYVLHCIWHPCPTAKNVYRSVLEELCHLDLEFPGKFAKVANAIGRTRKYICREASQLYPDAPHLTERESVEVVPGWYIGTNLNNNQKFELIRIACHVAGIRYGKDLVVFMD